MYQEKANALLAFIEKCPSCFHAVEEMKQQTIKAGFIELNEHETWQLEKGKSYVVTRNGSSMLAFSIGKSLQNYHFQITASHCDSPTFKLKACPEVSGNGYMRFNVEGYGGMLCSTWLDRPLSVAGRVIIKDKSLYRQSLYDAKRDLCMIPNLAIHMNREANIKQSYNQQIDMLPLLSQEKLERGSFMSYVAKDLNVAVEDIVASDLYLYNRMQPSIWGLNEEFISSSKLDDLQCAFASLQAFLQSDNDNVTVFACFDNEEVGSGTKQGAASTFLYDVLQRIHHNLGYSVDDYYRVIAKSFMVSCDNAHALHPNHPEKSDLNNCVYMNSGIVVKHSANQKYTTDAFSSAIFHAICECADVKVQDFVNRSDIAGGSTLGNISSQNVSLHAVDIGLAQLAMHSSYETAGIKDTYDLIKALQYFYNSDIDIQGSCSFTIK